MADPNLAQEARTWNDPRPMHRETDGAGLRAGGMWLAGGAALLVVSLLMHPPPPAELHSFMTSIAGRGDHWVVVHWMAAIAASALTIAGLLILTARSALTATPLAVSSWAFLVVGTLWTTTAAIAEATVMASAASAGDMATFEAWQSFAEGHAFGFAAVGLAVAGIAAHEVRRARSRTTRAIAVAVVPVGIAAFAGFVLATAMGVAFGGPVWLLSSLLLGVWLVGLGVSLVRLPLRQPTGVVVHA